MRRATLHNRVYKRVYNLNRLNQYINFHTKLQFMNGYVIGKLRYMLPLYTQANNNNNLNKIHKLIMRAAKVKQIIIVVDFQE